MPGKKSRHAKGKRSFQSKRKKGRHYSSTIAAQQQAVAQTREPVAPPKLSTPPVSVPKAALATARYPYIVAELRRIGILAGIILAILIVLALVLS